MANTHWAEEPNILFLSFFRDSGDRSKMIIEFLTFEWDTFHSEKKKKKKYCNIVIRFMFNKVFCCINKKIMPQIGKEIIKISTVYLKATDSINTV